MLSDQFFGTPGRDDPARLAAFVAVLLATSWMTYRWVERPAQRLGRRLTPGPPRRDSEAEKNGSVHRARNVMSDYR
jgi:peptidoglycan/LPS O-acetylase OafA/YrhL